MSKFGYYIWNKATGEVRPADMMEAMTAYTGDDARRVALTEVIPGTTVSTVFLTFDHGWGQSMPVLWETMVFSNHPNVEHNYQERYHTQKEAEEGHRRIVELVRTWIGNPKDNPAPPQPE